MCARLHARVSLVSRGWTISSATTSGSQALCLRCRYYSVCARSCRPSSAARASAPRCRRAGALQVSCVLSCARSRNCHAARNFAEAWSDPWRWRSGGTCSRSRSYHQCCCGSEQQCWYDSGGSAGARCFHCGNVVMSILCHLFAFWQMFLVTVAVVAVLWLNLDTTLYFVLCFFALLCSSQNSVAAVATVRFRRMSCCVVFILCSTFQWIVVNGSFAKVF